MLMWQWIKERLLQRSRKEQIDIAYERNRAAYNEEIRQRSLRAQIALDFNEAIGKPGQRAEIILFASMGGMPTYAIEWSQQNLKEVPTVFSDSDTAYFLFADDNDAMMFKLRWL